MHPVERTKGDGAQSPAYQKNGKKKSEGEEKEEAGGVGTRENGAEGQYRKFGGVRGTS